MGTVADFIDSARYDLRDYNTGLEFDDEELLVYINRMAKVLDSTLTALNSSFVHAQSWLALAAGAYKIDARTNLNSGNWDSIRSVWLKDDQLQKIPVDELYYKREFNRSQMVEGDSLVVGGVYEIANRTTLDFTTCGASANTAGTLFTCTVVGTLGSGDVAYSYQTGRPQYWALEGDYIVVEYPSDAAYRLTVYYNKTTATLTSGGNMPYSSKFDEVFREMLVMHAKAKKEGQMSPTEQTYFAAFRRVATELQIRSDFKPKYYHLDF
jgi:hypothetical protein